MEKKKNSIIEAAGSRQHALMREEAGRKLWINAAGRSGGGKKSARR